MTFSADYSHTIAPYFDGTSLPPWIFVSVFIVSKIWSIASVKNLIDSDNLSNC